MYESILPAVSGLFQQGQHLSPVCPDDGQNHSIRFGIPGRSDT